MALRVRTWPRRRHPSGAGIVFAIICETRTLAARSASSGSNQASQYRGADSGLHRELTAGSSHDMARMIGMGRIGRSNIIAKSSVVESDPTCCVLIRRQLV
jgi:hypothetical protein